MKVSVIELSVEEYLNKIKRSVKDIINNFKKSDTWKIQVKVAINFISCEDNDEEYVMHSKSDNIEIIINDKADQVTENFFKSVLNRYQIVLETSMRNEDYIFDCVHLLNYKCYSRTFKQGRSYIDCPNWIKNKKSNNKSYQ